MVRAKGENEMNSEIEATLRKIAEIQLQHGQSLADHDRFMAEHKGAMADHDRTLKEIKEVQLVHAKLILDNERDWKRRMDNFDHRLDVLLKVAQSHEDRMDRLEAAMERLFENMDNFIKGLHRDNGHS